MRFVPAGEIRAAHGVGVRFGVLSVNNSDSVHRISKFLSIFAAPIHIEICFARMAESVDALVSNTNDSNVVPVRPRLRVHGKSLNLLIMVN